MHNPNALDRHPCGGLPLDSLYVSVWYCHHHQAWFSRSELLRWNSDEPEQLGAWQVELGPFDTFFDVVGHVRSVLADTGDLVSGARPPGTPTVA